MTAARYASSAQWVHAVLERARAVGSQVPRYGTPEWCALPPTDPRFVAAVAIAAEAWLTSGTPRAIAERLAVELDQGRREDERRIAEEFAVTAAGVRSLGRSPTYETLAGRRGQPDRAARAAARTATILADARADPPDPR